MQLIERKEIDASLLACKLLALEALLSLISGLFLFILAIIRVASGIVALILALSSFLLWCLSIWQKMTESQLSFIADKQKSIRRFRYAH